MSPRSSAGRRLVHGLAHLTAQPASVASACLHLADRQLAIVEHGCREHRVGARARSPGAKCAEPRRRRRTRSPARARARASRPTSSRSKPCLGAVGVDRVDQQLARAALDRLAGPGERVEVGLGAAAVGGDDEARRACGRRRLTSSESTSTWAPNRSAISPISVGPGDRGAVHADLVGAAGRAAARRRRRERTPPPTVSGMKTCSAAALHHVVGGGAVVDGGRDVEEGDLVGALLVVAARRVRRGRPRRADSGS